MFDPRDAQVCIPKDDPPVQVLDYKLIQRYTCGSTYYTADSQPESLVSMYERFSEVSSRRAFRPVMNREEERETTERVSSLESGLNASEALECKPVPLMSDTAMCSERNVPKECEVFVGIECFNASRGVRHIRVLLNREI